MRVWLRRSALESDEQLLATIAHEAHELQSLRTWFLDNGGEVELYRLVEQIGGSPSMHSAAEDYAQSLIRNLRQ